MIQPTKKLGFGLMRLPRKFVKTDVEQVKEMVDLFCRKALPILIQHSFIQVRKLPSRKHWWTAIRVLLLL